MAFKFERLEVWQRSVEFADRMFEAAGALPAEYKFSLADQLRRAALSIPTNIAEGNGRGGEKNQAYFFRVAKGSVYEVVSLLVMVGKRGHLSRDDYAIHYKEADKIAAMLSGLINSKSTRP